MSTTLSTSNQSEGFYFSVSAFHITTKKLDRLGQGGPNLMDFVLGPWDDRVNKNLMDAKTGYLFIWKVGYVQTRDSNSG